MRTQPRILQVSALEPYGVPRQCTSILRLPGQYLPSELQDFMSAFWACLAPSFAAKSKALASSENWLLTDSIK